MGVCGEVRNKKGRGYDGFTTTQSEYIYNQIERSLCKIICKNMGYGTGFLCNFKYTYSNIIPLLITNNNILEKDDIDLGKTIAFFIGNEKKKHKIKIGDSRKKYINDKYNITIIEIKETDKINTTTLLEIDNDIFRNDLKDIYSEISAYLLYYENDRDAKYSSGQIKNIEDDNYTFEHTCESEVSSLGGPLLNLANYKVVGIHKGIEEGKNNKKIGILLKAPLEEFLKINSVNKKSVNSTKSNDRNMSEKSKEKKKSAQKLEEPDKKSNKKNSITMKKSGNSNGASKNIEYKSINKNMNSKISHNHSINIKKINLYFKFKDRKEIELKIKESFYFNEIIEELNDNYFFTKALKIVDFNFNGKNISKDKTLKENGLNNGDILMVIEE